MLFADGHVALGEFDGSIYAMSLTAQRIQGIQGYED